MAPLVEKRRPSRPFDRADILFLLGETICVDVSHKRRAENYKSTAKTDPDRAVKPPPNPQSRRVADEEPERWDGLS